MPIPINSIKPKQSPLELVYMKLYSTGLQKIYTNHFYKSMNHNFGVELLIKNNTSQTQQIKIGCCIYNESKSIITKSNTSVNIFPRNSFLQNFFVNENIFSKMKDGKYSIQFWLNDQKVSKKFFLITYK